MQVKIVEQEGMILVGVVAVGSSVEDIDISKLWQRFIAKYGDVQRKVEGKNYEMHVWDELAPPKHYCFIGVEVEEIKDLAIELFMKAIPRHTYAVFTHCFRDGGYGQAYKNIDKWLKSSQYTDPYNFDIQCYDERFQGPDDPESVMEFYIPVKSR